MCFSSFDGLVFIATAHRHRNPTLAKVLSVELPRGTAINWLNMTNTSDGERSAPRIDGQLLADLWVFRAAASSNSITAAASKLNVTQSAVSQRILRLESRLGCSLFTRHKSRIELSDAGASLLRAMTQVNLVLTDSLSRIQRTEHKALVVSCLPSLATEWLVPHLEDFYHRHPGIEIFVRSEQIPATSESLEGEGVDVLIDYRLAAAADLHELASVQEYVFPVCSRKYREVLDGPDGATAPLVLLHDDVDEPWEAGKRGTEWNAWRTLRGSDWPGRAAIGRHFNLAHLAYHAAMFHQGVAIGRAVIVHRLLSIGELVLAIDGPPAPCATYRMWTARPGDANSPVQQFARWWREAMLQTQSQSIAMITSNGNESD